MEKVIAYCGLDCSKCGAYLATLNNDNELRKKTAEEWSRFGTDIDYKIIYCTGCNSKEGKLFHHCTVCQARKCGIEKGLQNCAECEEYPCEKINEIHKMAPEAKANLDKLRN